MEYREETPAATLKLHRKSWKGEYFHLTLQLEHDEWVPYLASHAIMKKDHDIGEYKREIEKIERILQDYIK